MKKIDKQKIELQKMNEEQAANLDREIAETTKRLVNLSSGEKKKKA